MKCYVLLEESRPVRCAASYEELIDYQIQIGHISANVYIYDDEVARWVPVWQRFTQVTNDWVEGIKFAGIDNYNEIFGEACDYYIHESEFITP